jgi:hypothetical protein
MNEIEIERLEQRKFFFYQGFVFFWRRKGDENRIAELAKKHGLEETQKLINHEHLSFYIEDLPGQKKLAERLHSAWIKTLNDSFPNSRFTVSAKNEGGEFIVTVRNA